MHQEQMTFDFWGKHSPRVMFVARCGIEFSTFTKEIDALKWALKRPGAKVETIIV